MTDKLSECLDRQLDRQFQSEGGTIGTLIDRSVHATWQQRVVALAKVKGVDIV